MSQPSIDDLLAHGESVRALALRLCADAHHVDDGMQDAWLQALRRPPRSRGNLKAWLARTLLNSVRMSQRESGRRRRREADVAMRSDAADQDTAEIVARAELHQHLVARVLALPERPRDLVLRHYFEGESVNALAERFRTSPDAIRAHLRRARRQLRDDLERSDGRSAFATLVAATDRIPAAASATAVGGGLMLMTKTKLLGAAAAIAAVVWLVVPPRPGTPIPEVIDSTPGPLVTTAGERRSPTGSQVETPRTAIEPTALLRGHTLRASLIGLHPAAPWTTAISIRMKAREHEREDRLTVEPDGTFSVQVPEWANGSERFELRLSARDPWYTEVDEQFDARALDDDAPLAIEVRPVGVVTGTVLDSGRAPIPAARVYAFAMGSEPRGPVLARTNSGVDGGFRLGIPAATPVLVVAIPMHPMNLSGARFTLDGGGIADSNQSRNDLLPTWARTTSVFGDARDVGALILDEPSHITGVVSWSDGTPIENATVELRSDPSIRLDNALDVGWVAARSQVRARRTAKTDRSGRFALPAPAGGRGHVTVSKIEGVKYLPAPLPDFTTARVVRAPEDVELRLKNSVVTVRVTSADGPTPPSRLLVKYAEVTGTVVYPGSDSSRIELLSQGEGMQVCAVTDALASPWATITNPPESAFVDLEMAATPTVEMTVEIVADRPVRQARFSWHALDDGAPSASHELRRSDGDGPFRMRVRPGRYRLRVRSAPGERNGTFLVEQATEVFVPHGGAHLDLPVTLGGRLRIHATDPRGLDLAGSCRIIGADGREMMPTFVTDGATQATGRFDAGVSNGKNVLPPGTYRLLIDLGPHGEHVRDVQIVAREVAHVRIALE